MRSTEAQPYFQPAGEGSRFLPEGPRVVQVGWREVIAWVTIQRGLDSTHGSLFYYDPEESVEEGEQLIQRLAEMVIQLAYPFALRAQRRPDTTCVMFLCVASGSEDGEATEGGTEAAKEGEGEEEGGET